MGHIINENVIWRLSFLDVKKLGRALASFFYFGRCFAIHGVCIDVALVLSGVIR